MSFLVELESIIEQRISDAPEGSYTSKLVNGGLDRVLKKVGEEAGEVIIAAKNQSKSELSEESADLIFHLLIALQLNGLRLTDVEQVLKDRHSK